MSFKVDYAIPTSQREYGQVFIGPASESVAVVSVREGWLKVREPTGKQGGSEEDAAVLEQLKKLEGEAQDGKKGIWGDKEAGTRTIKNTFDGDAREFVEKYKGKPIDAIVEQIRDASTYRVLLMLTPKDHQVVTLFLSGIKAPTVRKDVPNEADTVEPFGEEAKFFVESRLLQRGVQILLEGPQGVTGFVGSIRHPAGNIAEALLNAGLARCIDWSLSLVTDGPAALRAAERTAKEKRLKIWTDHVVKEKAAGSEFEGVVTRVISADTLLVRDSRTGKERRLQLASIKQPPKEQLAKDPKSKEIHERGYQWDAREYLRKRAIGKNVHVSIDYTKPSSEGFDEKDCATVKVGSANLAEQLVERGYATVIRHRRDDADRAADYDALLISEEKAKAEGKGVHSTKEQPVTRISDASESSAKARTFLGFLQRSGRVAAVVDYVANGGRFNLWVPKESCRLTFVLGGIRVPRTGRNQNDKSEPFGPEALELATRRCMQRDVEIEVESTDKSGGFIGALFLPNGENFAVTLLEEGLSTIHSSSAEQSSYTNQLFSGERKAKAERKGIWSNYDPTAEAEEQAREQDLEEGKEIKREYVDVEVSEVVSGGRFYVQIVNDQLRSWENMIADFGTFAEKAVSPSGWKPKTGEIVSAKYTRDDTWYRAKVRRQVSEQKAVEVIYFDYGNVRFPSFFSFSFFFCSFISILFLYSRFPSPRSFLSPM